MKFTEKQIEKISALKTEVVEKVNTFENGVEYAKWEYFERIYAAVEKGDEKIRPYFYSMIGVYKKHVMDVLKK